MRRPRAFGSDDAAALSLQWIHILLALADGDKHGYAIMREVEELTGGHLVLWPATLYGALKRMREAGLLAEVGDDGDARRRLYRITPVGRQVLAGETAQLRGIVAAARRKGVT